MKIAVMGFSFTNPNKGCEALSYALIDMLQKIKNDNIEIISYGYNDTGTFSDNYPNIKFVAKRHNFKNPTYLFKLKKEFDTMDCILDVTYGDGFSDIYGKKWNAITNMGKQVAIWSKSPFVLMPQTFGPYYNPLLKSWAYKIMRNSDYVFSRGRVPSFDDTVIDNKIIPVTDLAFALPYDTDAFNLSDNGKIKIGFNISALLWDNGHSGTIKLKTSYRDYCCKVLNQIIKSGKYEVHLIPHVIYAEEEYNNPENDVRACNELHALFPDTIVSPSFENAILAKSYISKMDIFIGARMHATIGAISSGVATIPFSYSKKFEELFDNLDYDYVISARDVETEEAVIKTIEYINDYKSLAESGNKAMEKTDEKLQRIKDRLSDILEK